MTNGIIINLITDKNDLINKDYNLNEIVSLSKTLKIKCQSSLNVKINKFYSSSLFSKGKLSELKDIINNKNIDLLVCNYFFSKNQRRRKDR